MPTLHSYDDRLATLTARNLAASRRFADVDARRVPSGLRRPHSQREWLALDVVARVEHLTARAAEEAAVRLTPAALGTAKAKLAAAAGPAPAPAPAAEPVPARATVAGRYYVSCAHGDGVMVPARGPRPVVAYCRPRSGRAA